MASTPTKTAKSNFATGAHCAEPIGVQSLKIIGDHTVRACGSHSPTASVTIHAREQMTTNTNGKAMMYAKTRRGIVVPSAATVSQTPMKYGTALDKPLSSESYFLRKLAARSSLCF